MPIFWHGRSDRAICGRPASWRIPEQNADRDVQGVGHVIQPVDSGRCGTGLDLTVERAVHSGLAAERLLGQVASRAKLPEAVAEGDAALLALALALPLVLRFRHRGERSEQDRTDDISVGYTRRSAEDDLS